MFWHTANCSEGGLGSGNVCALEVASVVKFDRFRDPDAPHARAWVSDCAKWLLAIEYVLVVHVAGESWRGNDSETYARGWATLVQLSSARALGKITFDETSEEVLGGAASDGKGHMVAAVLDTASSPDKLMRRAIARSLTKAFPSAKVGKYGSY